MDYLRLIIALFLPWLGGYLWLTALENRFSTGRANTLRRIGYGLFIGYAAVQGGVLAYNNLFGTVTFLPILSLLALATLAGGTMYAKTRAHAASTTAPAQETDSRPYKRALFWLFVSWAALHLVFVTIEILHIPVFPWDAWLNWTYRAKAWFYSGHIFVMDHPDAWLHVTGDSMYNVVGNHYPTFSPVLTLWAATALGQWSETLINLPVLLCGVAMGLALYGQCREFGLEKWLSALAAYLLLSIPLVGTHLALAGQADIWMAGFTGLGFVALLHGIIRDNRCQILLGLGMAAMGIATKLEGTVWFLTALMTLFLAIRPAIVLTGLALATGVAALGWLMGITYLDLPLLGGIGLAEGRIHIPLVGSYTLQTFHLWDDYLANFFKNGTWHLLWTLVLLSAISLWFVPAGVLRRTIVAFYGVLLAAQVFIFQGTESGQWADNWAAINRLPLHFAPPLVFSLAILAQGFMTREKDTTRSRLSFRIPTLGLIITLMGATAYLLFVYPGNNGNPHIINARDMRIVVGSGRLAGDAYVVEQFKNNLAILSSGPVQLDTEQLGLLRVQTSGANQNSATFFWRNATGPGELHSTEISGRGTRLINLDDLPQWQGMVSEIGVIFYSDGNKPVAFQGLEITPQSLPLHFSKLALDWSETKLWSQKSNNWLDAGAVATSIPLPYLMSAWLLITLIMTTAMRRQNRSDYASVVLCAVAAWSVLDLRWTANSFAQAANTTQAYPLITASYLNLGNDNFTRQLVDAARPKIENSRARTIIMAEDKSMRFQMLRAKYHALPAATFVHEDSVETVPARIADYLLVLSKPHGDPGYKPSTAAEYANVIDKRGGLRATPLWDKQEGFLVEIGRDPESGQPEK
jgi:hypothetical protein